jgi:hypothetical protein
VRIGCSTGECEVDGSPGGDRCIQGEVEGPRQLRLEWRVEPFDVMRAWVNDKNAAIGRLQQRRHRSLRFSA